MQSRILLQNYKAAKFKLQFRPKKSTLSNVNSLKKWKSLKFSWEINKRIVPNKDAQGGIFFEN